MAIDPITLAELAALGLVGYEIAEHTGMIHAKPPGPTIYPPSQSATIPQKIVGVGATSPTGRTATSTANGRVIPGSQLAARARVARANAQSARAHTATQSTPSGNNYGVAGSGDPAIKQKMDAAAAAVKEKFDKASQQEKDAAAAKLNSTLGLNPPVTGNDSYEKIAAAVGSASGAAAGAYLCGPVCGKMGALIGAYLGTKIEDWCAKNMDEIEAWVKSNIGDTVEDAGKYVANQAEDAYNYVGGLL